MEAGEGMLARPARVRIFKRKKETGKPPLPGRIGSPPLCRGLILAGGMNPLSRHGARSGALSCRIRASVKAALG